LTGVGGSRIATGKDFDSNGKLKSGVLLVSDAVAQALAAALQAATFVVASVEAKPYLRRPAAPFRTTTLQQEAGRKLGFTPQRTMSVAQELYESGLITYMRTDSVSLSQQAIDAARAEVTRRYGANLLPAKPRVYDSKVKNAQEAHEAIRPAGERFVDPAASGLTGDKLKLYDLIWRRTLASQMVDAQGQSVSVKIDATLAQRLALTTGEVRDAQFSASGRTITVPGFRKAYVEYTEDDDEGTLPQLTPGDDLKAAELGAESHQTRPPARYTEPSLVAKLEELEIGRPSTYASIIRTITDRDYVFKKGSALVPTWLAFAVTRLLEEHFPTLIDYAFTADLEDKLDEIASGDANRLAVLKNFYFGEHDAKDGLHELVSDIDDIDARAVSSIPLGDHSGIVVRVGRYGTYVEDAEQHRANVPDSLAPDELTVQKARELLAAPQNTDRELGVDPATGWMIVAKDGRFGPYVTEVVPDTDSADSAATPDEAPAKGKKKTTKSKKAPKPPTASLFKTMSLDSVTLEDALRLLSLPRVVGKSGDDQILAQNGRFGPYLTKGAETRSLPTEEELFTVDLATAEALFAQPKARGRAAASAPLRELGNDPNSGKPVVIKSGRFGPYITDGEVNVTVPRTETPEAITPERAMELLAEKRAKGPATKRTKRTSTRKK
jgi:DNA topoisomerase-1